MYLSELSINIHINVLFHDPRCMSPIEVQNGAMICGVLYINVSVACWLCDTIVPVNNHNFVRSYNRYRCCGARGYKYLSGIITFLMLTMAAVSLQQSRGFGAESSQVKQEEGMNEGKPGGGGPARKHRPP